MKHYVSAKIHGVRVTDKSVDYNGSVSICSDLMRHAGIEQFEKVQIVNLENGNRWETYVIKSNDSRAFTLNGGGAFLGDVGDKCVVICYSMRKRFKPFDIIFCDENNFVSQVMKYENS